MAEFTDEELACKAAESDKNVFGELYERYKATSGNDMRIILWEAATGQQRHVLKGRFANIWNAAFSHSGARLACASGDKTVRLWDMPLPGK